MKVQAQQLRPAKVLYYSENPQPEYIMFNYFSFCDGQLNLGQCQAVDYKDLTLTREALKKNGWIPGGYKYVNGKAVLVTN